MYINEYKVHKQYIGDMNTHRTAIFIDVSYVYFVQLRNFIIMEVYIMDMAIIDGALKLFMLAGVIRLIK